MFVFGIHAVGHLERAGKFHAGGELEGVEVAFAAHNVHGENLIDAVFAFVAGGHDDEVYANGVFKALLIDDVANSELFVADKV